MKKRRAFIYFSILLLVLTMLSACSSNPVKYTLDISQEGEGTVKPAVGKHEIIKDTIVSLSADPAEGYQFEGWAGPDMSKISEEYKILINKDMEITAVFKKIEKTAAVQLSVEPGTYTGVQQLELSNSTEGAEIRYTTDGSDPTAESVNIESVNIYSEAITLIKDTTVKSVSIKDGLIASDIVSADYVINYNLTTNINKAGAGNIKVEPTKDYYKYEDSVELTAGANSGYDFSSWSVDLTGKSNPETLTIDANKSVTANFTAWGVVSDPVMSVLGGTYTEAQLVTITNSTAGSKIYYTTDGSVPTATTGTLYSGAITINDDSTLKARAVKAGMNNSNIVSEDYVINYSLTLAADPAAGGSITADPDKTTYKYNETVELTAAANTVYEFSSWSGDLTGSNNPETITMDANKTVTANFTAFNVVSDPAISLAGGSYTGAQSVTINTATADAEIYYTTDGSVPTAVSGTFYSEAITINDDTTLKAVAVKAGMNNSNIISEEYVINYSLTLAVDPADAGSINADLDKTTYKYNETVELTAAANSSYEFSSWSGDLTGSTNPETLTIDANKSVTANFTVKDFVNGDGSEGNPYQITNWYQLAKINSTDSPIGATYLELNYILMNDLDTDTPGYQELASSSANEGKGWVPVGNNLNTFQGIFDGNNKVISDLWINSIDFNMGLFGVVEGTLKNIGLENIIVFSSRGQLGGLVGRLWNGNIENSYITGGEVTTNSGVVGGLVGWNNGGIIKDSYSTVIVEAESNYVGGLVGDNDGTIVNSYTTGEGTVTGQKLVGGLVGNNDGTIDNSYSTNEVIGYDIIGGLVGSSTVVIKNSYATGRVESTTTNYTQVGGLVGTNSGQIKNCYSIGEIVLAVPEDDYYVGSLVGVNSGEIIDSFSLTSSFNIIGRNSGTTPGRVTEAVQVDMQSGDIYTEKTLAGYAEMNAIWDSTLWNFGSNTNPAYPSLSWE